MKPEEYPIEPPRGIFHFPPGVFCLMKKEDTGKETVSITRVSGNEFEFTIIPVKLTKTEQKDFPIRLCEYEKIEERDLDGLTDDEIEAIISIEPEAIVKSERKMDLTTNAVFRQVLKDDELIKIGNTITYAAGDNLITLDDSVGAGDSWGTAYDMDDVLANCGAVVTKQGANAYDVSARMQFNDGVYFVSENEFVEVKPNPINPAWTWRALAGSHLRFGYYDSAGGWCSKGSFWKIYVDSTTTSGGNYYNGETLIYGSTMWNDASGYTDAISFEPSGTTKVYASVMAGKAYMRTTDIDFQDVKWINEAGTDFSLMVASGYDYAWAKVTTINGSSSGGIFMSGTTTSAVDLYDVVFQGCTRDVNLSGGCNWLLRLINSPTFSTVNSPGSGKPGMKTCYTFNVLVTDKDNHPLSGALVVLKDNTGSTIFSLSTEADGKLATDQIVTQKSYRHSDDGGTVDYNDHVLKITLNGYSDYETDITVDHKIEDDQVCLDALTYTFDNIMAGITDIKGTGFVKDTDSLVDIRPPVDDIRAALIIRSGTVTTVVSQYLEFNTDLAEATSNYWTRAAMRWTSGNNEGAIRKIQLYQGSMGYIKLRTELVNSIQAGDTFDIIPLRAFRINHEDVEQVVDEMWDEATDDHVATGTFGRLMKTIKDGVDTIIAMVS